MTPATPVTAWSRLGYRRTHSGFPEETLFVLPGFASLLFSAREPGPVLFEVVRYSLDRVAGAGLQDEIGPRRLVGLPLDESEVLGSSCDLYERGFPSELG